MYLLDTNTLIYFFRDQGNVTKRLFETEPQEICVSVITVYELEVGIAKSSRPKRRREQLNTLLEVVSTIVLDRKVANTSAHIRASLEKIGQPIGPMDTLIAGTALSANAILVTRKQREFSRVKGLSVEDWYE